jgi:hypothetical protein
MYFHKFIVFIFILVFASQISAEEFFIRLTSKGIQSKKALLNQSPLLKSSISTDLPDNRIAFKKPIQRSAHKNQFDSWLKVVIPFEKDKVKLDSLLGEGVIDYYEPIRVLKISQVANDSLIQQQWYLETIKAKEAWQITTGSQDIIIGVIDTGIDYTHPDLKGSLWINNAEKNGISGMDDDNNGFIDDSLGWDFTDAPRFSDGGDYIDPDNDPMDEYGSGHGTQIAGIIAAQANNGIGITGIGPNLSVMNLRAGTASGYLEEDDVANALIYALDNGARIVNMSFGDVALSRFLKDIIYYTYQQGLILIASAGNSGNDEVHYPSGLAETISVGATDKDDNIAGFSNYGPTLDCVAPGSEILSTAVNGKYNIVSGTSFSAPVVAAIAGLILSVNVDFSSERVRNILKTSADDILYYGWDNYSGAGRISALNAVSVPDGGILKFIKPMPNSSTALEEISIIGTALHPDIKSILLAYGEGKDPQSWLTISEFENQQILADTIGTLNTTHITDSLLTLRLVMTLYNGNADEIRTNLKIDRTAPVINSVSIIPLYDGTEVSKLISFKTDDITSAKIYVSENFETRPAVSVELDYETNNHQIKINESEFSGNYQFYIEAENQSHLVSIDNNNNSYYSFTLTNNFKWEEFKEVSWTLPTGYLLDKAVDLDHDGKNEIIISRYDENQAFGPIEIYEFEIDHFEKRLETVFRAIPRDAGDVDNDGLSDLLLGYGKLSFLFESNNSDQFPENQVWSDTVNFWAAGYADLDNDGRSEIIGRNDSSYIILENYSDNTFKQIGVLINPTAGDNQLSIPKYETLDINNDHIDEFIFGDYDGDIIVYESTGDNVFQLLTTTKVSQFDATSLITGININNKSKLFTASHSSDELDYEHEFDARYWAIEQFEAGQNNHQLVKSRGVNIYGYQNLKEFDSGLMVQSFYDRTYLFTALYPNIHVFKIEDNDIIPVWYSNDIRSNTILVADFDGDLIEEFYYNDGTRIKGLTLPIKNRPNRPHILNACALDSARAKIQWSPVSGADYYQLYRGTNKTTLIPSIQIENDMNYIDSKLSVNEAYYYAVSVIDSSFEVIESLLSPIDSIKTGFPPKLISGNFVNERQILLIFNKKIEFSDSYKFTAYSIQSDRYNTSALIMKDQTSILTGFSDKLNFDMTDTIIVKNIFDLNGIPIDESYNKIAIDYDGSFIEPYLMGIDIVNSRTIELTFSEAMNETDLLQTDNYQLYPWGEVKEVEILDDLNTIVRISLSKDSRVGGLGVKSYLQLKNIHSALGILLQETNKIYLNEEISDLSKVFIYPQPVRPGHNLVTFAKLPDDVTIHIFNINGKLIRSLDQDTYFNGIQWDLKDANNQSVHSGIYIYRIVHLENEKIGKLVIVR